MSAVAFPETIRTVAWYRKASRDIRTPKRRYASWKLPSVVTPSITEMSCVHPAPTAPGKCKSGEGVEVPREAVPLTRSLCDRSLSRVLPSRLW